MRTAIPSAILFTLMLSACGSASEQGGDAKDLKSYVESSAGKRAIGASVREAERKRPPLRRMSRAQMNRNAVEGGWTSMRDQSGITLRASFSRDGVAFMEEVDASGSTKSYAQGTVTVGDAGASGTLTRARNSLAPFAKWTMRRLSDDSWTLIGDGRVVALVRRRAV